MSSAVNFFKIFPKHNGYDIFQSPLVWINGSLHHTHTKTIGGLVAKSQAILFPDLVIIKKYLASVVIVVSPNPSVGSSPITSISSLLWSGCP